ncbi:MAG: hypothetical protein HUJ63_01430 [Enterococcus sp.]|nr:hypothetical protein [Enterococcus sp.]
MGRGARAQTRQAEHGCGYLSDWGQAAAARFLREEGVEISVADDLCDAENADKWEIQLDARYDEAAGGPTIDYGRMEALIGRLRTTPGLVVCEDGVDRGEALADVLEDGVEASKKHGYDWIVIDWW